jgi:hypothetical protein
MGWMVGTGFPEGARDFSLLHRVHPASYPMGTEGSSMGIKRLGHEADHSTPSSAMAKNGEAILPLPHISSWRGANSLSTETTLPFTIPQFP